MVYIKPRVNLDGSAKIASLSPFNSSTSQFAQTKRPLRKRASGLTAQTTKSAGRAAVLQDVGQSSYQIASGSTWASSHEEPRLPHNKSDIAYTEYIYRRGPTRIKTQSLTLIPRQLSHFYL
jgi:hypothetical protein